MLTTKLIIPFADNQEKPLPKLFNILISFNHFSMQDVPDKVKEFRSGNDLSFEIQTDKLPELLWYLNDAEFVFKPDSLLSQMVKKAIKKQLYTTYSVIKTTWGINVKIIGTIEEVESTTNKITISAKQLLNEQTMQVELGLQSLLPELDKIGTRFDINIQSVEFNISDFQLEGLYWASRDWLAKALNIKVPEPQVSYDKVQNKYIFAI